MAIKQVAKGVFEFVSKTAKKTGSVVRKVADKTIGKAIDETIDQLSGIARDREFLESEQYKNMIGEHPVMAQGYYDQYSRKMDKIYGKGWEEEEKRKKKRK
jgi:hypothetical protein